MLCGRLGGESPLEMPRYGVLNLQEPHWEL